MAVNTSNIIQGPADLYLADFGATEPANTLAALQDPPTAPAWADMGATTDAVSLTFTNNTSEIEVQQVVEVVGRRTTRREVTMETSLAETTLTNLQAAIAGGTITDAADGVKKMEAAAGTDANPNWKALMVDGLGKDYLKRRLILRKVMSSDDVEYAYDKEEVSVFSVTFATHYISSSIRSWVLLEEDPTVELP